MMKLPKPKNWWFLIPVVGGLSWTAMLITLLAVWSSQGHPMYPFVGRHQTPVYISHIGATDMQPVFITGACVQGICYIATLITEYRLRKNGKLQFWFKKNERNLMSAATILGAMGQIGILLCAIFKTTKWPTIHHSLLGVFIIFVMLSMICVIVQYFLMGKHYQLIHVEHHYWNKFRVSGVLKSVWIILSFAFALIFELVPNKNVSSYFEWILAFFYLALYCIFAWDLSFAARHTFKKKEPRICEWNGKGFYKYDEHFGDDGFSSQQTSEKNEMGQLREFSDEQLAQYPLQNVHGADVDEYPMQEAQNDSSHQF